MKTVQAMLAEAEAEVPRISPDEAKGLLGRTDVLFLDVREPAEVATSGKVPGALAVPRGLVEFRADPASALHDAAFDRAKTVIAYCGSGGRSALVGKTLKEMGYTNVRNLRIQGLARRGRRGREGLRSLSNGEHFAGCRPLRTASTVSGANSVNRSTRPT
jgi:rhodanese-related sulfurtransferase